MFNKFFHKGKKGASASVVEKKKPPKYVSSTISLLKSIQATADPLYQPVKCKTSSKSSKSYFPPGTGYGYGSTSTSSNRDSPHLTALKSLDPLLEQLAQALSAIDTTEKDETLVAALTATLKPLMEVIFDNDSMLDMANTESRYKNALAVLMWCLKCEATQNLVTPKLSKSLARTRLQYNTFEKISRPTHNRWDLATQLRELWSILDALEEVEDPSYSDVEEAEDDEDEGDDAEEEDEDAGDEAEEMDVDEKAEEEDQVPEAQTATSTPKKKQRSGSSSSSSSSSSSAKRNEKATSKSSRYQDWNPNVKTRSALLRAMRAEQDAAAALVQAEMSYKEAFADLQFGEEKLENHAFNVPSFNPMGFRSATAILRLSQELSALATSLPLSLNGSIFVRVDSDRMDLMRALITGPPGTPYENGLFLFDIGIPSDYPTAAPRVLLRTTNNGTIRFNPNLYANGTVCLSLLGTWSGDSSERWSTFSTLVQLLVSIQSLVLNAEPYFNEPSYESMRGTAQGTASSTATNEQLKGFTQKYAIQHWLSFKPTTDFDRLARLHLSHTQPKLPNVTTVNWLHEILAPN